MVYNRELSVDNLIAIPANRVLSIYCAILMRGIIMHERSPLNMLQFRNLGLVPNQNLSGFRDLEKL
jgi:hypothetical protein